MRAGGLRADLIRRFQDADAPIDDVTFTDLAVRVFSRNFETIPAYADYCRTRGLTPGTVDHWTRIPAVPTAAFSELTLRAEDMETERVFRTSGTTRGMARRGEHHVADLELYRTSLRSTFRSFLLPDDARLRFLSLMPAAHHIPDSSLAYMITDVMKTFGAEGSAAFATADGLDFDALTAATRAASEEDEPVLLIGTSAAFIHWLDRLVDEQVHPNLPEGSRLMDTGGHKGRGRQVPPEQLRAMYARTFGLPDHVCVNEYGMTELLSQRYDGELRRHLAGADEDGGNGGGGPRRKEGPGWLRTVAVDPEMLTPLPDGASGILRHIDLANMDSIVAVQTEDFGRVAPMGSGAVILEGRATGAPPRGCSLAMDLLLDRPT